MYLVHTFLSSVYLVYLLMHLWSLSVDFLRIVVSKLVHVKALDTYVAVYR